MGSSQSDKAASHKRILKAAARRIRRDGVEGVNVAELMREAGLTHGGFYRHFESREALVAEAVEEALANGSKRTYAAAELGGTRALEAIVDGYLSGLHRDKPETGCAVAALPTDVVRCNERARAAYTTQVRRYLEVLADLAPDQDRNGPHAILATLVGALTLARAVDDAELSDEILERSARALHEVVDQASRRAGRKAVAVADTVGATTVPAHDVS
ncbi:MAG: TetR/AcrR family transcriptional regulator, transcriptional repressor for nem operon [Thermoleophilaceae bacterium]|nr:TetR/AcrR family transcriptional regulator, transcriptional repressor for nem operon [Thermoleophilaceae bacterium]